MVGEAVVDKKGRIVIPRNLREELGLHRGAKVRLTLEEKRILITRPITPEKFIHEMEGCIRENSSIPMINPLELKKIWGKP